MNEQTRLSTEDAAALAALQFRGEMLKRDQQILALETQLFQVHVRTTYGNPGEALQIMPDNGLLRTPAPKEAGE